MAITELMRQKRAAKWLADDRNNAAFPEEETKWCRTEWEPRALDAGWKYWAIVLPKSVVGQLYMKALLQRTETIGLIAQLFDNPDDAMTWLKQL
jgi:hypothetical protein